jgi:hypothetical protein
MGWRRTWCRSRRWLNSACAGTSHGLTPSKSHCAKAVDRDTATTVVPPSQPTQPSLVQLSPETCHRIRQDRPNCRSFRQPSPSHLQHSRSGHSDQRQGKIDTKATAMAVVVAGGDFSGRGFRGARGGPTAWSQGVKAHPPVFALLAGYVSTGEGESPVAGNASGCRSMVA